MTYRAVFSALSFQKTKTDDPSVPVGDPVLVARGEALPEWVTPFQVNALVNAGMIVNTGDERPAYLAPEAELPAQPRTPDQPDVLPSDPNGSPLVLDAVTPGGTVARPGDRDGKAKWEAYAVQVGVPQAEAESLSKAELMAEVDRRESGSL